MKLIIAIINKEDSSDLIRELNKANFMSTKLATTGGFLRAGNITLLIGTEEERVEECLDIMRKYCSRHTQLINPASVNYADQLYSPSPISVTIGGATVFVVEVDQFIKM